jgi:hypothetical protein
MLKDPSNSVVNLGCAGEHVTIRPPKKGHVFINKLTSMDDKANVADKWQKGFKRTWLK